MKDRRQRLLRKGIVLFALVMTMFFTACGSREEDAHDSQTYIFCRDADGLGSTRIAFVPKGGTTAEIASSYLTELGKTPTEGNLLRLLPDDVDLVGSRLRGSVITLDFSGNYNALDKSTEVLVRSGYVRTLIQVPGIEYVVFTVGGEPLRLNGDIEVGPMNADTFIENAGKSVNAYLHHNITLYYADETGTRLVPEGRSIYYNSNKALEWAIVERLIAGPKAEGSFRSVAAETKILSIATQDRTCYVNLSESFNTNRPAVSDEVGIYSIVNSLIRNCEIDNVQISIEGSGNVTFGSSIELGELFQMNKGLILETH